MSTGNLPFTDDSAKDVSWPFGKIRWQDGNGSFCGIPDFQMQPGNGNFSRRSDIHKIIPECFSQVTGVDPIADIQKLCL